MPSAKPETTRPNAKQFIEGLKDLVQPSVKNEHALKEADPKEKIMGVRMGELFALAKAFQTMPVAEVDKMLDSEYYEVRMGAVCIMDFHARDRKTTEETRKELYELYIGRHDRINHWDMVDRSAPYVVGGYLHDKPRKALYKLAKSKNVCERRTAIVSTYFFIRQGETDDTFDIAELLVHDKHEFIHKAVGSWIREAGKKDPQRLRAFLDKYAATMARITLRYAIEKMGQDEREHYLRMGK